MSVRRARCNSNASHCIHASRPTAERAGHSSPSEHSSEKRTCTLRHRCEHRLPLTLVGEQLDLLGVAVDEVAHVGALFLPCAPLSLTLDAFMPQHLTHELELTG